MRYLCLKYQSPHPYSLKAGQSQGHKVKIHGIKWKVWDEVSICEISKPYSLKVGQKVKFRSQGQKSWYQKKGLVKKMCMWNMKALFVIVYKI